MKLNELFNCEYDLEINSIEDDSRIVSDNYLFFCIKGIKSDGHKYVSQAIENGAVAIVASEKIEVSVPVIYVDDTNLAMNEALNKFYNDPLSKLKLIAATGTDGKTTTTSVIYQIIKRVLGNCGLIGTNGAQSKNVTREIPGHFTTPFPKELFSFLNDFALDEAQNVAIEVTSERLLTNRLEGIEYDIGIFTNISNDHLNVHGTVENYIECKSKLFESLKSNGLSILNADDKYCDYFKGHSHCEVITYGILNGDVRAANINIEPTTMSFDIEGVLGNHKVESSISGRYNVYNIMAAIIACTRLGLNIEDVLEAIKVLEPVEGRSNVIEAQNYKVIIDYAHNPNALKNLLEYANTITKGRVITVTGSAGGRDAAKRPIMGDIVINNSDYVIFTEDDPRNEDPKDIAEQMIANFKETKTNYEIEVDRKLAIKKAIEMAQENDTVVIAGRGNDTNMPVKDGYVHLNDFEEVKKNIEVN